jgi:Stress-induced morphogen (activity unknown)
MAMKSEEIEELLKKHFPDASISITDMAGDGNHYQLTITSGAFTGQSRIRQHQMVYAALEGKMGGELHALALTTRSPD